MKVIDTHAHLEELNDVQRALAEAREAGVIKIVGVGSDSKSNQRILALAKQFSEMVVPALGLHPWNLEHDPAEEIKFIEAHIDECIALGEVGMDYWIDRDQELQRRTLETILKIAVEHDKPAILHSRGAWQDVFELVRESNIEQAVFHWYSGPIDLLHQILDVGYYISATPAAEYSRHHQRAIVETPIERIVLETDTPVNYRGMKARPVHVLRSLNAVAKLKGLSPEEVAEITTRNAIQVFRL